MRFKQILTSVVVVLSAASSFLAQAQIQRGGYAGPGRYEIANVASGKVLDLNRQDQRTVSQSSRRNSPSWRM